MTSHIDSYIDRISVSSSNQPFLAIPYVPWNLSCLMANNHLFIMDNLISLPPAQLLWTFTVIRIDRSVEEVAQVIYHRSRLAELGESAGSVAAEGRRESARLNKLRSGISKDYVMAGYRMKMWWRWVILG